MSIFSKPSNVNQASGVGVGKRVNVDLPNLHFHMSPIKPMPKADIKQEDVNSVRTLLTELSQTTVSDSIHDLPSEQKILEKLEKLIIQPGLVSMLEDTVLGALIGRIKNQIFRDIPEIPKHIIYGDSSPNVNYSDWPRLRYYHRFAVTIIKGVRKELLLRWINKDFVLSVINLYNSWNADEQNSAVSLTEALFEHVPDSRSLILKTTRSTILQYLDGTKQFPCVAPCLKFYRRYMITISTSWTLEYTLMYKNIFMRLFATEFLPSFYVALRELCKVFYSSEVSLASLTLSFLLKHWPMTNSTKQMFFLQHLFDLAPLTKPAAMGADIKRMFKYIGESLASQNFKVCGAALTLISDLNWMCVFSASFRAVIPALLVHVDPLRTHWNEEVRDLAATAVASLQGVAEKLVIQRSEEKEEDREEIWQFIHNSCYL